MMKKKTAMIIGSPGPFSSFWRQWIAKQILPRLSLITNREPLSTSMLSYIGIKGNHIHTTACPSVLFESASEESMKSCEDYSVIFEDKRPTIGLILCGWNMPKGPYSRWPREDWEFKSFVQLVSHLKRNTNYRICLMSHQNSTTSAGSLCKGNDHRILEKLIELLGDVYDGEQVFTLKGLYDAAQSKAIIGQFDLLVSGRIHGAVQGLSQCIPAVILDYGHEPKAHKLIGFSMVYDTVNLVVDPRDGDNMCNKVEEVIARKEMLTDHIKLRLPMVVAGANLNFALLKAL
jgi:colanic acid/amylovoran biosynthesis protein